MWNSLWIRIREEYQNRSGWKNAVMLLSFHKNKKRFQDFNYYLTEKTYEIIFYIRLFGEIAKCCDVYAIRSASDMYHTYTCCRYIPKLHLTIGFIILMMKPRTASQMVFSFLLPYPITLLVEKFLDSCFVIMLFFRVWDSNNKNKRHVVASIGWNFALNDSDEDCCFIAAIKRTVSSWTEKYFCLNWLIRLTIFFGVFICLSFFWTLIFR